MKSSPGTSRTRNLGSPGYGGACRDPTAAEPSDGSHSRRARVTLTTTDPGRLPHTPSSTNLPATAGPASPYTAYSVSWNLTQRCNLECAHCYMSAFAGADTRGELTTA